jgi:ribose-phosphate pyrophosphokinase
VLELQIRSHRCNPRKAVFPGGESLIRIPDDFLTGLAGHETSVGITLKFEQNGDLIDLMMLVDAVRRAARYDVQIDLYMPYLPYARQDRVCNPGESLSVKVVADMINSLGFRTVACSDIHSEVGVALINNLRHFTLNSAINGLIQADLGPSSGVVLVSPDAGSNKKVFDFAKTHGYKDVVRADKKRDVETGKLTGFELYADAYKEHGNRNFLILDDICDGGGTFIGLAQKIREITCGDISLYVSHGIFSKGIEPLTEHIDFILTGNLMHAGLREELRKGNLQEKLTVFSS